MKEQIKNDSAKKSFFHNNKYRIIITCVIVIYSIVSFINLGNTDGPRTFAELDEGEYVIFQLLEDRIPSFISFFVGYDESAFTVSLADEYDGVTDTFISDTSVTTDYGKVFSWQRELINIDNNRCRYIMISSDRKITSLGEVTFLDGRQSIIKAKVITGNNLIYDEQELVKTDNSYLDSTYFDEIYFPRAAYEIFHNLYIYEFTHPPLGKIVMWIPVALFGMTPFNFRLMGNIAGILMIVVLYEIAKELFKSEKYATFAGIIIALDGMHFAQTRIATVDSFLVLFSMLAILFFIKYLKSDNNKSRFKMLLLSGIMWGCAVATKWTACYVGLGLGIVFFADYFVNKKMIVEKAFNYKPIIMGIVCFVIVPIVVYALSYLPIYNNPNDVGPYSVIDADGNKIIKQAKPNSIGGFLEYQYAMFKYHSNVGKGEDYTPHPFSSKWYSWPVIYKPMWFYLKEYPLTGSKSIIVSMGNPAIWWLSIWTFFGMAIYTIIKKDTAGNFLLIMIAATWLPFAIISREMYIYHYFLTSVLMMLTIVFVIEKLCNWKESFSKLIPILSVVFLILFIYFYPVFSGMVVSVKYIEATKWLSSWIY